MTARPSSDWEERAACRGTDDPELFFPSVAIDTTTMAQAVCGRCPVTNECAAYGKKIGATYGVWGGECKGRDQEPTVEALMRRADIRARRRAAR